MIPGSSDVESSDPSGEGGNLVGAFFRLRVLEAVVPAVTAADVDDDDDDAEGMAVMSPSWRCEEEAVALPLPLLEGELVMSHGTLSVYCYRLGKAEAYTGICQASCWK